MKKWICLLLILVAVAALSFSVFAEEKYLIDFSLLKANSIDGKTTEEGAKAAPLAKDSEEMKKYDDHTTTVDGKEVERLQHVETLLDYSGVVGSNFNQDDKKGMKISLGASNWIVELNSSAAFTENKAYSFAKEWHTKANDILVDVVKNADGTTASGTKPEGFTVMGVRVKFPELTYNCWALLRPPFDIPAYEDRNVDFAGTKVDPKLPENRGTKYENGYGVIKNVGVIKRIEMRIYGLQFKNSISILLQDDNFVESEYHFPEYLDFDGWRKITWTNPNYINTAANRDLFIVPLYPRNIPYIKLQGFRIYRQGDQLGGNFVSYIKDVKVTYDLAVLELDRDIDHETAWNILSDRTKEAKNRELLRIGDSQLLQYIERKKMHNEAQPQ